MFLLFANLISVLNWGIFSEENQPDASKQRRGVKRRATACRARGRSVYDVGVHCSSSSEDEHGDAQAGDEEDHTGLYR